MEQAKITHFEAVPVGEVDQDIDQDKVANDFRHFLEASGAIRVEPVMVSDPEPGTRGPGEITGLVTLAVSMLGTTAQVVDLARRWLRDRRHDGVTSIRLRLDGQTVEVFGTPTYDEERKVEEFLRDHATP